MRAAFLAVVVYSLALRLLELELSRRHGRRLVARGGRRVPDAMGWMVLLNAAWFVALGVEELVLGPTLELGALRWAALVVAVAAELARLGCIRTLGERWSVRVIVLDGAPLVRCGPYRWLRHPNYVALWLVLLALPLAVGLPWTALGLAGPHALVLRRRIRLEEAALAGAAGPRVPAGDALIPGAGPATRGR